MPEPERAPGDSQLVSVIIPTIRRPGLVQRAVASVQAQTWRAIEIIVVIDGPDPLTADALAKISDPRLRVVQNPVSLRAGGARNAGAEIAAGQWLAFLDDDDEWLPRKLELQLAGRSSDDAVLVTCRCWVENAQGTHMWPHRLYDGRETIDDYLFNRKSPGRGDAYLATPTFVLPAWLFARSRFGDTRQEEDTTLVLRLTKRCGARIEMLPEPLVVVHESPGDSLGFNFQWRESLAWLDSMGDMVGRRAYSGFCLIVLGSQAARQRDVSALPVLVRGAFRRGAPTGLQIALFASFWILPAGVKRRLAALLRKARAEPVVTANESDAPC
jgi:hypothetical protein